MGAFVVKVKDRIVAAVTNQLALTETIARVQSVPATPANQLETPADTTFKSFVPLTDDADNVRESWKEDMSAGCLSVPEGNKTMGLNNIGLSCFVNSVLNSLYFVPAFYHYFFSLEPDKQKKFTFLIRRFVLKYGKRTISAQLLRDIRNHFPKFRAIAMKSAAVFLLSLLQCLSEESHQLPTAHQSALSERSPSISDIFTVEIEETRTCLVCQASVSTLVPLLSLSLRLKQSQADTHLSIESCLSGFLAEERDTEETAHLCRECDCDRIHKHFKRMIHIGHAIVIYLQRYSSSNPYAQVTVPTKLKLSQYGSEAQDYVICAAIHHEGWMEGGHYTCCANASNGWMHFNDSIAQFVNFDPDFFSESTLFIYTRHA